MTDPWGNPLPQSSDPMAPVPTPAPVQAQTPDPAPPSTELPAPPPPVAPSNPAWPGVPVAPAPPSNPAWPAGPPPQISLPKTSGTAVASLVLGITSLTCSGYLGFVLAPLAVIFGVRSRRTIAASNGWRRGDGMAVAGIVLGIIGIVVSIIYLVFVLRNPQFIQDLIDRLPTTTTVDTGRSGLNNA